MDVLSFDTQSEIDSENGGLDAAGPIMDQSLCRQRLIWARNLRGQRWQNVVFSDSHASTCRKLTDASVSTGDVIGATLQLRTAAQRYGGGGVMVWAAINHRFKSQLIVCQGNLITRRHIDQILRPVIVPMFRQRQGLIFQHDNA